MCACVCVCMYVCECMSARCFMCEVLTVDTAVSCQGGVGSTPSLLLSDEYMQYYVLVLL